MNLTTRNKVKRHLGIPLSNTTKDAIIDQIIPGVSGFIEAQTNRKFGVEEYTEIRDGEGFDEMVLRQYPIVDVISLTINGSAVDLDQEEEDESFILDREEGSIYREAGFSAGRKNIKVVYTAGYAAPEDDDESGAGEESGSGDELPSALEAAAIRLSARVYERRTAEGVSSVSPGSFSVQYKDAVDADIVSVLESFKKRRV